MPHMNRHARRAAAAQRRHLPRADTIAAALEYLANHGTATGVTLILPSGEMLYLSREQALAAASAKGGARC